MVSILHGVASYFMDKVQLNFVVPINGLGRFHLPLLCERCVNAGGVDEGFGEQGKVLELDA